MSPTILTRLFIFLFVLVLIDLYAWKGISTALGGSPVAVRRWSRWIYWAISIGMIAAIVWTLVSINDLRQARNYSFVFSLVAVFMLFLLPKLVVIVFHFLEDVVELLRWLWGKMALGVNAGSVGEGGNGGNGGIGGIGGIGSVGALTRIRFLSQVGLALAAVPFVGVIYGITHGRRNFKIARVRVPSPSLPHAFDGLRIVQISDLHLGSFHSSSDLVRRGVDLINAEKPDLILFTGDLVNDYNEEALPWLPILAELRAPLGKFSILGNHDYSDYAHWDDPQAKAENLRKLIGHHATMGFRILLDEHVGISRGAEGARGGSANALSHGGTETRSGRSANELVEMPGTPGLTRGRHDSQAIGLLGVQNWGHRFQQYGDLAKTMKGTEAYPYRILMSHDPSHWDGQVLAATDAAGRTGVDLMLSGHTHGAQFGITIHGTTYSPAQWVYKQWAGLYEQDGQYLYVNRGFGYIGFPGRIGMPPEITVLELVRA